MCVTYLCVPSSWLLISFPTGFIESQTFFFRIIITFSLTFCRNEHDDNKCLFYSNFIFNFIFRFVFVFVAFLLPEPLNRKCIINIFHVDLGLFLLDISKWPFILYPFDLSRLRFHSGTHTAQLCLRATVE